MGSGRIRAEVRPGGVVGALPPRVRVGVRRQQVTVELDVELGRAAARTRLPHDAAQLIGGRAAVRSWHGAKVPKIPAWSVVWLAPVPRSRSGRSALTTTTRRPVWCASMTAGSRLPTAVPDVVTTATGRRDPVAETEREESRRPLVDAHVQAQVAVPVGRMERQGEGSRARARREHDVPHPAEPQLLQHAQRELRRSPVTRSRSPPCQSLASASRIGMSLASDSATSDSGSEPGDDAAPGIQRDLRRVLGVERAAAQGDAPRAVAACVHPAHRARRSGRGPSARARRSARRRGPSGSRRRPPTGGATRRASATRRRRR